MLPSTGARLRPTKTAGQSPFIVHPGLRAVVRRVIVNGLNTTNPELVNQRIDVHEGDPLSQVRISDAQRRLYDLGIFAKVQTAIQNPEGQEESKYVLYQLEEARRYSINVGLGPSSRASAEALLRSTHRPVRRDSLRAFRSVSAG